MSCAQHLRSGLNLFIIVFLNSSKLYVLPAAASSRLIIIEPLCFMTRMTSDIGFTLTDSKSVELKLE
jgi:hypothetical protein